MVVAGEWKSLENGSRRRMEVTGECSARRGPKKAGPKCSGCGEIVAGEVVAWVEF